MTDRVERSRRALTIAAVAIAVLTALRFLLSWKIGLAPDEAYYWQWSRDLALTYPDHPPLVAWLVRLGTAIAGETPLGVRLVFPLLGAVAALLVYRVGRALGLDRQLSALAALLASVLPAPAVGALLATPETPTGLCWLAAVLALIRLATRRSPRHWYLLGAALGIGLLAKHSALLLVPAVVLAAVLAPRTRADLRTIHPWLALLLALVVSAPHWISELGADTPAYLFQLQHLSGELPGADSISIPARLGALVSGQLGLLTPLVALMALVLVLGRRPLSARWRIAAWSTGLPVLATAAAAFFVHPEQNWAALGHPIAAALAVGAIALPRRDGTFANRARWSLALVLSAASISLVVHLHALRPFLPLPAERDPVSRLHGWNGLAELAPRLRSVDAVVCDNYGLAAELAWYTRTSQEAPPILGRDRAPEPRAGRWLLLDERDDWADADLAVTCSAIDPVAELRLSRDDGDQVRAIQVSLGTGCRPAESLTRARRWF